MLLFKCNTVDIPNHFLVNLAIVVLRSSLLWGLLTWRSGSGGLTVFYVPWICVTALSPHTYLTANAPIDTIYNPLRGLQKSAVFRFKINRKKKIFLTNFMCLRRNCNSVAKVIIIKNIFSISKVNCWGVKGLCEFMLLLFKHYFIINLE